MTVAEYKPLIGSSAYANPLRDRAAFDEATHDPIYLAQSRYLAYCEDAFDYDGGDYTEREGHDPRSCEHCTEHWKTEHVFMWRDEAQRWMDARHYRWEYGHRVYCICAEGSLARLLKETP